MRAAQRCHICRICQNCKITGYAAVSCRCFAQFLQDRAFSRPSVDKQQAARLIAIQQIPHGVVVNALSADNGNGIMRQVGMAVAAQIPFEQDASRNACPCQ